MPDNRFIDEEKLEYYRDRRNTILRGLSSGVDRSKEPAKSGVVVLFPVFVLGLVIYWLAGVLDNIPLLLEVPITGLYTVDMILQMLTVLVMASLATAVTGQLVTTERGFRVEKALDRTAEKIPVLGTVYRISKVTADTVVKGPEELREPVKLDFNGVRLNAFRTGNTTIDGRKILVLPTAPNVTSGLVLEVDPERYGEPGEDTEEILTRIFSAGFGHSKNGEKDS